MKRAVNLRLEESAIYTLNQLSTELHTTKTVIIERAIELFSEENKIENNGLLRFAGVLKNTEADKLLADIRENKDTKEGVTLE